MRMMSFASRRVASLLLALSLWLSMFIPPIGVSANATAVVDPLASTGQWSSVIDWQIVGKHMALLPNCKVLAWPTGQDAFLWDPATQLRHRRKSSVPPRPDGAPNTFPEVVQVPAAAETVDAGTAGWGD